MKEKIKKFYSEHKDEVIFGSALVGVYAFLTVVYAIDLNRMRGYHVAGVGTNFTADIPEGGSVVVHLRNGEEIYYSPPSK